MQVPQFLGSDWCAMMILIRRYCQQSSRRNPLYIFWILHQTTTFCTLLLRSLRCISFESYIKPQPPAHHPSYARVVYLLTPTSNHNLTPAVVLPSVLYIFWLLHQTTTYRRVRNKFLRCISFDSYIKPQLKTSYAAVSLVVYLLTPTSNHNLSLTGNNNVELYIFWLLHQTTTQLGYTSL